MLRKTKLYLDKTIKVESAESTSDTGNGLYKELSVFNRALGKGGGSGLRSVAEPALGKPGAVLLLPASWPGGASLLLAKHVLLSTAPALLEAISHSQELHGCTSEQGSFSMYFHTACGAGCIMPVPPLRSFFFRVCFAFHFLAGVALALIPGVHLTLGNTSPSSLVCLSVFTYYKTFVPLILSCENHISSSMGVSE